MSPPVRSKGRWDVLSAEPEGADAVRELAQGCLSPGDGQGRIVSEVIDFQGGRAWLKGAPLHGSGARRHGLKRLLWRRPLPRLAEFHNLAWLRDQHFEAPRPLGAAVLWRGLLPRYQLLVTAHVEGACALEEELRLGASDPAGLLGELGRELARMHALGFVHHDVFLRNLLVVKRGGPARVVFLDAWAAGRYRGLRGPSYDLACLFLDCAPILSREFQVHLWRAYIDGCRAHGRAVEPQRLVAAIERQQLALRRRLGSATDGSDASKLRDALAGEPGLS